MTQPFFKKLKTTQYALKLIISAVLGGLLLNYAMDQNATFADIVTSFAALPVEIVLFAELLDKFSDTLDFRKLYVTYYDPEKKGSIITATLISLGAGALIFIAILYAITGTITLSIGNYTAGSLVAAGLAALYILLPETGDDELMLFGYLAATIATGGDYFNSILLAFALGKTTLSAVTKVLISGLRG